VQLRSPLIVVHRPRYRLIESVPFYAPEKLVETASVARDFAVSAKPAV
jgi:hypothetical protein